MVWFYGMIAISFLLVVGLAFTSEMGTTALLFIPIIALGAWVIRYHYKHGGKGKESGEPVFSDDEHYRQDRAA